ncbi:Rv3235 family protein [Streptomyces sp. ME19-01-6]|uniref:Rv3235 family protein n=1 Tax=Streptomyces sp. ME19-01-6 TaxID=3028686 RepID=UPI0029BF3148|nr:Rv3235 family protein [Streptomyces sp. ME19-01-6]MDX3232839.1 Rv3235 family protein [Streptomyces sp. ME19-01-6]
MDRTPRTTAPTGATTENNTPHTPATTSTQDAHPGSETRSGPVRSGPAPNGPTQSGPTQSGPAQSRPARSGSLPNGPTRSRPPLNELARSGSAGNGPATNRPAWNGPTRNAPAQSGPALSGPPRRRDSRRPTGSRPVSHAPGSVSRAAAVAARRRERERLPRYWFANQLLLTLSGQRPVHTLLGHTLPAAYDRLVELAPQAPLRPSGARDSAPVVQRCGEYQPRQGVIEAFARIACGDRLRALAFRLELGLDARWRCAAVDIGPTAAG